MRSPEPSSRRLAIALVLPVSVAALGLFLYALPIPTLPFDPAGHPLLHVAVLGLSGAAAWRLDHRRVAGILLAVTALAFGSIQSLWSPSEPVDTTSDALRVVVVNVLSSNPDPAPLLEFLVNTDPDVLGVLEVDDGWAHALDTLGYAHRLVEARPDNFGIALYSRYPLQDPKKLRLDSPVPTLVADLDFEGTLVHVVVTHPLPPISLHMASLRDRQLSALADLARELGSEVLVLGDLNTARHAPRLRRLLRRGGLHDTCTGLCVTGTWPARAPGPLRLRLDHALVGDGLLARDWQVGPDVGSDHRPVVTELALASNSTSGTK